VVIGVEMTKQSHLDSISRNMGLTIFLLYIKLF
jgi:hypothetical protein